MRNNRTKTDRLKMVWAKTKGFCAHCGNPSSGKDRTVDHYVPRSYDGGYDIRNLMPLCRKCNAARANEPIDPFEFYKYAPEEYIRQCIEYEDEHKSRRRNFNGDIFL